MLVIFYGHHAKHVSILLRLLTLQYKVSSSMYLASPTGALFRGVAKISTFNLSHDYGTSAIEQLG